MLCMHVMQYTVLPMVSHFSTDPQMAVINQRKAAEEDCKLVNKNVNNAGFNIVQKLGMFYRRGNAFRTFV